MDINQILAGVNSMVNLVHSWVSGSLWFILCLLGVGILYTVILGVPQIRSLGEGFRTFFGKGEKGTGDIRPKAALFSALSGTVGTGNIGGVALAISLGGPAALLWMWVTAALGMATKLAEISLSHKYRKQLPDGSMGGGPMNVIGEVLKLRWLAIIFVVMVMLNAIITGASIQMSTISITLQENAGIPAWAIALVFGTCAGVTILAGVKGIARVTEKLVPFMQILYVTACLIVIFSNLGGIPEAFWQIFSTAFTGSAVAGGFLGAGVAYAIQTGVARALFSSEAGQGSSPIIHAASDEKNSVREGTLGMLEPMVDTLFVCTLTGLAILASGVWQEKYHNRLETSSTYYIEGRVSLEDKEQIGQIRAMLRGLDHNLRLYDGEAEAVDGKLTLSQGHLSVIAHRSLAEDVLILQRTGVGTEGSPYTGRVRINNGRLSEPGVWAEGKSLLQAALLTSKAFEKSLLGPVGPHIVSICLVLFAFSTVIVWSYYGDRSGAWLWGVKAVLPYRLFYVGFFVLAAFIDTSLLWRFGDITNVLMAMPNLIMLVLLSGEVRRMYRDHLSTRTERPPTDDRL